MMLAAAHILPGAKGRLLPPSIPFAFFAVAIVFHILAWAVAILAADEIPSFEGGLGHPLGALHALTLGVLASTAMGATFQLLPVATRRPHRALWPARLAFWSFAPGVMLLVHGMGEASIPSLVIGGALAATALVIFSLMVADNLLRSPQLGVVAIHGWIAILSLAAVLALGLVLAFDFRGGFLADHPAVARAHAILGLYGFMGMLALGFGYLLIPMFALAEAVPARWTYPALAFALFGLAAGVGGVLFNNASLAAVAAAVGALGALVHITGLFQVLRRRMRRRLGVSFLLLRIGLGMLPTSLIVGAAAALGRLGPRGAALFGFIAACGWLLTFLLSILQRILPFLASMHTAKGGRPPLVSELTNERALTIHAICHVIAVASLAGGIALDLGSLIRLGAIVGLVGALAFAWFGSAILYRVLGRSTAGPSLPAGGAVIR